MTTTTSEAIEAAAAARGANMRADRDRPQRRRNAPGDSPVAQNRAVVHHPIEVRAAAGDGGGTTFEGYASVTEQGYQMFDFWGPYTEVVSAGAFGSSLARADLDVPLVLQHDPLRRIARTTNGSLQLTEDETGLHTLAPDLDPSDPDVAYIAPKLRSGLIDEMSFRFDITAGQWSPDYTEFRITETDIHRGDVAIVGYGANPATSGTLRSFLAQQHTDAEFEQFLRSASDEDVQHLLGALTAHQAQRSQAPGDTPPQMSLRQLLAIDV